MKQIGFPVEPAFATELALMTKATHSSKDASSLSLHHLERSAAARSGGYAPPTPAHPPLDPELQSLDQWSTPNLLSAVLLSHTPGALQLPIDVAVAESAETPRSLGCVLAEILIPATGAW